MYRFGRRIEAEETERRTGEIFEAIDEPFSLSVSLSAQTRFVFPARGKLFSVFAARGKLFSVGASEFSSTLASGRQIGGINSFPTTYPTSAIELLDKEENARKF